MMRVLVVGTVPSAIEAAVTQIVDAGHEVARCHESGEGAFPCAALSEGRACPLEGTPVDVAVTVRDRAWPRPSPFEDGAICALRRRIPLVVAGSTALQPFERWSSRTLEDGSDLVAACEEAAAAPLPEHGEVARQAATQVITAPGLHGDVEATVWRRRGALQVEITVPAGGADLTTKVAARVTGALREFDGFATAINVTVAEAPPTQPRSSEPPEDAGSRS
jgi:hypothetical protein